MKWSAKTLTVVLGVFGILLLTTPAHRAVAGTSSPLEVSQVDWQTIGTDVHFHLQFHNTDPVAPSDAVAGEMRSQPFGAFMPDFGPIGSFNVPPLAPDSFFDVFFDVALTDLPPSADKILPGGGPGGTPGLETVSPCPPDEFWAGNVDVFWSGPGGSGQVNYHNGTILICPGAGPSYIHVVTQCDDPVGGGASWSIGPLCPGWHATLVTNSGGTPGGPAPDPLPPGFFDGWICVSADLGVTVGSQCCFTLDFVCNGVPATITLCAEACDWQATPTTRSTWGGVKALYR